MTYRCGPRMRIALGLTTAVLAIAPPVLAQSSKTTFEKYKLMGTFAWDCSKPASKNNLYYVNRELDAARVQHDQMSGPTTRDAATIIDTVTESKPNEIALTGTRDGKTMTSLWRIEQDRVLRLEMSVSGEKWIAGGRYSNNGNEVPALRRCGG